MGLSSRGAQGGGTKGEAKRGLRGGRSLRVEVMGGRPETLLAPCRRRPPGPSRR